MNGPLQMIGSPATLRPILEEVQHAARSDAKVLITGESGVGKEIAARLVHANSQRSVRPLLTVNCAGLPETLLESELFGHARGSFTGAYRDKHGILELAHGGTVFLDEVGEMSLRMQALLLRFLENGEVQRVGHHVPKRVEVRVIAATNRDLMSAMESGRFRRDLYYRLNVLLLTIPPLRERTDDIPILLDHFLALYSDRHGCGTPAVSHEAARLLTEYRWPGNVRELRNVCERLVLRRHEGQVRAQHLPAEIQGGLNPASRSPTTRSANPGCELFRRIVDGGESFWIVVQEPFLMRDLTRADVRQVVDLGLKRTQGSYRVLTELFNMPSSDYKRFLNFLRKHDCHLAFLKFRAVPRGEPLDRAG